VLPVRLLGVGASRLAPEGCVQGQLFDADLRERQTAVDRAVDAIRGQFGAGAIRRGSLLDHPGERIGDADRFNP
jgi:DNA polymerase-4